MLESRRDSLRHAARLTALLAAALGLPSAARAAYNAAAFEPRTLADLARVLGAGRPVASAEVTLTGPDVAENGAAVPLVVACSAPSPRRLLVLVERNPNLLSALFELTDAVEPSLTTRVKMNESSPVYAVAQMGDGRLLYARKEIRVTQGGCGA